MKKLHNARIVTHSRIYKYSVPIQDAPKIRMPSGAVPIHFGVQNNELFVWAMVNGQGKDVDHHFKIYGTGHALGMVTPDDYVGTAVMPNGLVWHLFYVGEP